MHFVTVTTVGTRRYSVVADATASTGRQLVTVRSGGTAGHIEVRLVSSGLYIRGDGAGLVTYLGMPSNLATKYAGRWIYYAPSVQGYKSLAQSMTVAAAVDLISLKAPLTSASGHVAGATVTVIHGTTQALSSSGRGPASLAVAPGTNLPIVFTGQGTASGKRATGSVTYSAWGEPVVVATPAHSVPISDVR